MQIYNTYVCPNTDALMDIGTAAKQWKDIYINGLAYIDGLGEDLDAGDFNIHSMGTIYGFDDAVYINFGVNGYLTLAADTRIDINNIMLVKNKIIFTQTDGNEYIDSLADGYMDYGATTAHRFNSWVRHSSASYRRYYHLALASFDPGASGATWTNATANNLSGWQLNAATEFLRGSTDIHPDWDGASNPEVEVYFQLLSAGSADDTVDLKMVFFYMGVGDVAPKTQTVEVPTTTDGTQYKMYKASFELPYDTVGQVVDNTDQISFVLNLETDTSEIDNILITGISYYYHTTHIGIESGDA